MAPLTRRRAAAQDGSQTSSQDATTAPPSSATKAKAKRKSVGEDAAEASDILSADTVTPKRQKLAVRAKGTLSGDAPSTVKSKRSREALIADSQDSDNDDTEPTPYQVTKQLEEDARQRLSQEPNVADPSPKPAAAAKSKRIVFDNDDDVKRYVAAAAATAKKAQSAVVEQDAEDSDDEAPEAVTASAAAEESKKAAQALTDAVERQAATTKRKRQQRDNTLKQQAQKRERAKKVKPHTSKSKNADSEDDDEDEEAGTGDVEKATTGRRRAEKFNLPSVLPAEFLTDSEDESEDERDLRVAKKPKKIKFDDAIQTLSKEGRGPRDEIVGSTAYRVVADQGDEKLAPRANHNSKNVKEMLLHRRRVGVAPNKANGFFKRR